MPFNPAKPRSDFFRSDSGVFLSGNHWQARGHVIHHPRRTHRRKKVFISVRYFHRFWCGDKLV
jgi:hypothetical protein